MMVYNFTPDETSTLDNVFSTISKPTIAGIVVGWESVSLLRESVIASYICTRVDITSLLNDTTPTVRVGVVYGGVEYTVTMSIVNGKLQYI